MPDYMKYKLKPYIILLADIGLQKVPAAVSLSVLQRKIAKREKARPKRKARHHKGVILAKAILVSGLPKPYRKLCNNMKMIYLLCELFIIFLLEYKLQNKIHCELYFNS